MLQTCEDIGDMIGKFRFISIIFHKDTFEQKYFLETEKKKLESELSKYEAEKKSTESEMNKLKVSLYAKFGDQIHLERE